MAQILEEIGLESVGAPGTTAALALLNDQVKKGGVMASSYVGGLSGAFIPVSEDQGMIDAVTAGYLTIEKLEAMTCVCSVGLDMIAIPGNTSAATISGIVADGSRDRNDKSENNCGSRYSRNRQRCRRYGRIRRTSRLCAVMPVNKASCEASFRVRAGFPRRYTVLRTKTNYDKVRRRQQQKLENHAQSFRRAKRVRGG